MSGVLIGVGIGPGDPELVTLAALRAIETADRVVAPTSSPEEPGRAETVVTAVAPSCKLERFPWYMGAVGEVREGGYVQAAERLVTWLDKGERVVFVTLGDPGLYSTFAPLASAVLALSPTCSIEVVPGIAAFQAVSAKVPMALTQGAESLSLISARDGIGSLEAELLDPDRTIVIYKGGRWLPQIVELLASRGRLEGAWLGEHLGLENERLAPLSELVAKSANGSVEPASYLLTVIVPPVGKEPMP
jgi:precorrin-2/cobalt-factor-2 C20-methyltransferase